MSEPADEHLSEDENDLPPQRRWVRSDEISVLVKHMQRVIPDGEWAAAIGGAPEQPRPSDD
ncbi:MAG: hypothetical protein NTW01_18385 [Gammaproteobacteria bacterium]|nr:hypothetical protein [Gammaproteobacteria bacterium]